MLTSLALALAVPASYDFRVEHRFFGAMPTGVTVSKSGRKFVCFPRWGDDVKATVVELKGDREVPYPNASTNDFVGQPLAKRFVSVQSVVVDAKDRLWAVDTGSVKLGPNKVGGPRLWSFDLKRNRVARIYTFPRDVVPETAYLNDVRFDLTRGKAGYAIMTDSSAAGPNGIVVLDLASGESWRKLNDHPSTKAEPITLPTPEGYPLLSRPRPGIVKKPTLGSDGIAIFPKADRLVYCPLISRTVYSVPLTALEDRNLSDEETGAKVSRYAAKPASDGLHEGPDGRLLVTDVENARVTVLSPDTRVLIRLNPYEWPDTLSVQNGRVYLIANQLQGQPSYHEGKDLRRKPYRLVSWKYQMRG